MKRGTLAKRLGYYILRNARVPFKNQKGHLVRSKKTGLIRTKHASSIKEFKKYYEFRLKPTQHAQDLKNAIMRKTADSIANNSNRSQDQQQNDNSDNPFSQSNQNQQ